MAELEVANGRSVTGPVRALGRWGILGILPRWLGEQVAAGGRIETWSDVMPLSVPMPRAQADVDATSPAIAPRATAFALRRTIDAWRATERDLAGTAIDGRDRARLQEEFDVLCATHHRLFLEVSLPNRFKAVDTALG